MTETSRRTLLAGTAAAAAAAVGPSAAAESKSADVTVAVDGKYPVVPLRSEAIRVCAVQSPQKSVDAANPKPGLKANLARMLNELDAANGYFGTKDLVCFHEFPLTGWAPWSRADNLKVAIDVPGEETEALGKKAKQYNCYIAFGTFARDKDWPGHVLSLTVLIGPGGNVVARHWKPYCMRDLRPGYDLFTTGVYEVLPRYIEMYGADEVLQVARTDIGNLSLSSSPTAVDVNRALAIKGTEIFIRTSTGGFPEADNASISLFNRCYTVIINNAISPGNPGFVEYAGAGNTAIYAPGGRILASAKSIVEELVDATVPIGDHRKRVARPPEFPIEMVMPVYQKYVPRYPAGMNVAYQPADNADAAKYYATKRRW
jgi:predicted amidohydrolase